MVRIWFPLYLNNYLGIRVAHMTPLAQAPIRKGVCLLLVCAGFGGLDSPCFGFLFRPPVCLVIRRKACCFLFVGEPKPSKLA